MGVMLDFANMAAPVVIRPGALRNRKSMTWATYMSNMVLLEESEPTIPNSPDYGENKVSKHSSFKSVIPSEYIIQYMSCTLPKKKNWHRTEHIKMLF